MKNFRYVFITCVMMVIFLAISENVFAGNPPKNPTVEEFQHYITNPKKWYPTAQRMVLILRECTDPSLAYVVVVRTFHSIVASGESITHIYKSFRGTMRLGWGDSGGGYGTYFGYEVEIRPVPTMVSMAIIGREEIRIKWFHITEKEFMLYCAEYLPYK